MAKKKNEHWKDNPAFVKNIGRFGGDPSENPGMSAQEAAQLGGDAAAEKARRKREFREIMAAVDEMDLTSKAFKDGLVSLGFDAEFVEQLSQKEGAVAALNRERLKGNVKAFEMWAKMIGEYTETVNVNNSGDAPLADGIVRFTTKKQ